MKLDIPPLSKEQIESENKRLLAIMNGKSTAAPSTAIISSPRVTKLAHLLALANEVDDRGLDAAINCVLFHRRYPKEG